MSERRVVKVTFLDHVSAEDVPLTEIREGEPVRCVVYGELMEETEDHIKLLSSYEAPDKIKAAPEGHGWIIVKSCVLKIEELKDEEA